MKAKNDIHNEKVDQFVEDKRFWVAMAFFAAFLIYLLVNIPS
jgi:hypothetical protein